MPRRRRSTQEAVAPPIAATLAIRADSIYRADAVRAALGLGAGALREEWRASRLRILRRCNRNFILGKDILAWLDGGELPSPAHRNGTANHVG